MKLLLLLLAATAAFGQQATNIGPGTISIGSTNIPAQPSSLLLVSAGGAWDSKRVMLRPNGKVIVEGGMTDREALELVMRRFAEYAQEKCYSSQPITGSTTLKLRGDAPEGKK